MTTQHYEHLKDSIQTFFHERGVEVVLEPHGTRGADIENAKRTKRDAVILVGEIKHDRELRAAMDGRFWRDWHSRRRFGGKLPDERLSEVEHIPATVDALSSEARGFVATIQGQLKRSYVKRAGLREGWLVVENGMRWEQGLISALEFLSDNHLIADYDTWRNGQDIIFVRIQFTGEETA